ncbi:MAG: hypothetical protein ACO34G_03005 [Opitutales bacterium]
MPLQLVFTSAPQGLTPGRSGYCTVARHRAVPDRLAQLLESVGTPHEPPEGETFTFRTLEAGDRHWFVLSRFVARGLDYTQRDNRLAHHLIFTAEEAALLAPPAALAARWKGWLAEWTGAPVWLEGEHRPLALEAATPLSPAVTWREATGTGAKAAWLVDATGATTVGLRNPPANATLLKLFAEASALIGKAAWHATFTTDARITGEAGFVWAAHAERAATIDFVEARTLPAPTGDLARQAAAGLTSAKSTPVAVTRRPGAAPAAPQGGSATPWIVGGVLLVVAAGLAFLFTRQAETPAPAPAPVVAPAPSAADLAQQEEILRVNRAVTEIQSLLETGDMLPAARLWLETNERSPARLGNYKEQLLPRILNGYSAGAVRQLLARIERRDILDDPKASQAAHAETLEVMRVGKLLGVPEDAAWKQLLEIKGRTLLLPTLDVRPVLAVPGRWRVSDLGPKSPVEAEFPLSRSAVDRLTKWAEEAGASSRSTAQIRLRVLPLVTPHQRDERTPYVNGEIRVAQQTTWFESNPEPGRLPAIGVGLGARRNVVSLNFTASEGAPGANLLIEIILPKGDRRVLALIGDAAQLRPLDLGVGALRYDADTGVIRPAPWAEGAVNAFVWAHGQVGLYPAEHGFPDRDLPSVRATRSLLETDLLRLEARQGPDTPPYEEIAARRKAFREGRLIEAGAPWAVQAVDAGGSAGPRLLEFR